MPKVKILATLGVIALLGFLPTFFKNQTPETTLSVVDHSEQLKKYDTIIVTGGAGFIGSSFVRDWVRKGYGKVIVLDSMTYAASMKNLEPAATNPNYIFVKGSICDQVLVDQLLEQYKPKAIVHFAAESHVDRSIENPALFLETNVKGTFVLLEASRRYMQKHPGNLQKFIHISTDEVYGSLGFDDPSFTETTFYTPTTPYSATKAASDHLVHAWFHTYKVPVVLLHCSNNYGPYQYPEKLIPKVIGHALRGEIIPVYGNGKNVRDWIHVEDHCRAIETALAKGRLGENYNIGGSNEKTNLDVVKRICTTLDATKPPQNMVHPVTGKEVTSYHELIAFTNGRVHDDQRYSMNSTKIQTQLGWKPAYTFESGIDGVTTWYLDNPS